MSHGLKIAFLALTAAVGIAAIAVARNYARQTREIRVSLATLQRRSAGAEKQLRDAQVRIALAEAAQAEAETRVTAGGSPETEPAPAESQAASRKFDRSSREAVMQEIARVIELTRNDPAVINAELEAHRPMLAWRYADFFRQHGIDGETREKFLETALRSMGDERDLFGAATSLGIRFDDPAVEALHRRMDESYLGTQRDLVGEPLMPALNIYEEQLALRNIAAGVAGMAVLADAPMSEGQVRQLGDLIVQHVAGSIERRGAAQLEIDWAGIDESSRAILNERQHALFTSAEGLGARFILRLNQEIHRAVSAAPEGAGAAP
jgi:hypothetical protein